MTRETRLQSEFDPPITVEIVHSFPFTARTWGARFDWLGFGYLVSLAVSRAPSIRIVILGISLWVGKIPSRRKQWVAQWVTETAAEAWSENK